MPSIQGTYLKADGANKFLPTAYKAQKKVLYKNQTGETKLLSIRFLADAVEYTWGGQTYLSDRIDVALYDETDAYFVIRVLGGANYSQNNQVVHSVAFDLMPGSEFWLLASVLLDENGKRSEPLFFGTFLAEVELNSRKFKECFFSENKGKDAFSELYVNSTEGVVAFRDKNNELFVFDKFE